MTTTCPDSSLTYLASLQYSVVKEPSADVVPYLIIGQQEEMFTQLFTHLGSLSSLLADAGTLPPVQTNIEAADVNNKTTDNIAVNVGIDLLGGFISALGGGQLGANVNFNNVRTVQFTYQNVLADNVAPLDLANYLQGKKIRMNSVVEQFSGENGKMFCMTRVIKSNTFTIEFKGDDNVGVSVDVPAIQGVISGGVKVQVENANASKVSFTGTTPLGFGFQCYKLFIQPDQTLTIHPEQAGDVQALLYDPPQPVVLSRYNNENYLISFKPSTATPDQPAPRRKKAAQ